MRVPAQAHLFEDGSCIARHTLQEMWPHDQSAIRLALEAKLRHGRQIRPCFKPSRCAASSGSLHQQGRIRSRVFNNTEEGMVVDDVLFVPTGEHSTHILAPCPACLLLPMVRL